MIQKLFNTFILASVITAGVATAQPIAAFAAPAQITSVNQAAQDSLAIAHRISREPLMGGDVTYAISIRNNNIAYVTGKRYNLTISDTLPAGITYTGASPAPTFVSPQKDGSTQLFWDNIIDLEAGESLDVFVSARLATTMTLSSQFTNTVVAKANTAPDNSGVWLNASSPLLATPQAIDINVTAQQSTAEKQATGADWAYKYRVEVRNNNVGSTDKVIASVTLPAGVAYLGNPAITNANAISVTPALKLLNDGALQLDWSLGQMTTARYNAPIVITFDAAIPYRFRTVANREAGQGAFAGPMKGEVIPEGEVMPARYEATGTHASLFISDGTQSTPNDDASANVTAKYMTIRKSESMSVAGINDAVNYTLDTYVSEYYTATNTVITDTIPDGMSYVDGSASLAPFSVERNTPAIGQTTLTWRLPDNMTQPGQRSAVTYVARVNERYAADPYTGQPIVSGDSLINIAVLNGAWLDVQQASRAGSLIPEITRATVRTAMPAFNKEVWDPQTNAWAAASNGFTGDTARFRLTYAAAAKVGGKAIIIRDFLPRGMAFVNGSDVYAMAGTFNDGAGCTRNTYTPQVGTLSGLQFLEWRLCNVEPGSTWQVIVDASIADIPDIQPGWIVGNFGKLSGVNTPGLSYSLRGFATVNYVSSRLVVDKTATPPTNLIPGSVVTYKVLVTNAGDAPAYNVVLTDVLPAKLIVATSGGKSTPINSTYTTLSGDPANGNGGTVQWSPIASIAKGQTVTYQYTATVKAGVIAGEQLTNLASVSYNTRSDNNGHFTPATSNVNDDNTDSQVVYIRGASVTKSGINLKVGIDAPDRLTIGDSVRWTITGSVPAGVVVYWPVVEENLLPDGFDYISGTSTIMSATLDTNVAHHAVNPADNGNNQLRWYLNSIDNTAGAAPYTFTIHFDTLATGVNGLAPATQYYPLDRYLATARNTSYIGWYDNASGYNNTGYAFSGFNSGKVTRLSPKATYDMTIRQPYLDISKRGDKSDVVADDIVTFVIQLSSVGNSEANEITISDTLPAGMSFITTQGMSVIYPAGFPNLPVKWSDNNIAGTTNLSYSLDVMYTGAVAQITYTAKVDAAIAAGLRLTNTAQVVSYSSMRGITPDTNKDGLPDERIYNGPTAAVFAMNTPAGGVIKSLETASELSPSSNVTYKLLMPPAPINATMYDVQIKDAIDARLKVLGASNAAVNGNLVSASFASIPPMQQQTIVINAALPADAAMKEGQVISNTALIDYRGHIGEKSNDVLATVEIPALTIDMKAGKDVVRAGDTMPLTLTVTNVGKGMASGLMLQHAVPDNMACVAGSAQLNGQAFSDATNNAWQLPDLRGSAKHTLVCTVQITSVDEGASYIAFANVKGIDALGNAIPADNGARVPADTDLDDTTSLTFYGPLITQDFNAFIAYEDLKGTGWSDWDYNDFIVKLKVVKGKDAQGNLVQLQMDYEAMSRGAGYDHLFRHKLPVMGGGVAELILRDANGNIVKQHNISFADKPDVTIFDRTWKALPAMTGSVFANTLAAQTNTIKGYTASVLVKLNNPAMNNDASLPALPWDPYIFVTNTNRDVHLLQPGLMNNTQVVNSKFDPSSPMVGTDMPLAHIFPAAWNWPIEQYGIWRAYPQYVDYIASGKQLNTSWFDLANAVAKNVWAMRAAAGFTAMRVNGADTVDAASTSRYYARPVALTVNNMPAFLMANLVMNRVEMYDASQRAMPGWPQNTTGNLKAAPVVADLNGDGQPEVVIGDSDGKLYAWQLNGAPLAGFPVRMGNDVNTAYRILATPAVADLDKDGTMEIVVSLTDGRVYAVNANGTPKWNTSIGDVKDEFGSQALNSSPAIADVNGDGMLKVIVGGADGKLYMMNADGSPAWSFATGDVIYGTPAVGELDASRAGLEVVIGSADGNVYALENAGNLLWQKATGWAIQSSALIANIDGIAGNEIIIGSGDGKVWAWHRDGSLVNGWPVSTGAPALANLDDDAAMEVIAGDLGGKIHVWGVERMNNANKRTVYLPMIVR